MQYDTVEIRPNGNYQWRVQLSRGDGQDREGGSTPHALGFFHYPRKLGKKKAFEKLKACMIQRHKDEIEALQKSLASLEALDMPSSVSIH